MSNKKILISGCGLSAATQQRRTWSNALTAVGADLVNLARPAVSNSYVINEAICYLINDRRLDAVVIQLTSLGKLDVVVDPVRRVALVEPDPSRNFTFGDLWPSSLSDHHISKKHYYQYLFSPYLEQKDMLCKLALLKVFCDTHNIDLLIFQGYAIDWHHELVHMANTIIDQGFGVAADIYHRSAWFAYDQGQWESLGPVTGFQIGLAAKIDQKLDLGFADRLIDLQSNFDKKFHAQNQQS
jgi:hypothetical protein